MFKAPLVVGYKGEIGSFILNGLLREMPKALDIWCFDINESEEEKIKRIKVSDVIFLCVPIQNTIEWLLKYKKYLKDKIILEQCSIKSFIYENKDLKDLKIMGMHILFRPSITPNIKDRTVALANQPDYLGWDKMNNHTTEELGRITGAEIIWFKDYKEHDMVMARQQALVHRVLLSLDKILIDSVDTYISKKIRELCDRIKSGDKTLYNIIQSNKNLPEVLEKFKVKLNTFKGV